MSAQVAHGLNALPCAQQRKALCSAKINNRWVLGHSRLLAIQRHCPREASPQVCHSHSQAEDAQLAVSEAAAIEKRKNIVIAVDASEVSLAIDAVFVLFSQYREGGAHKYLFHSLKDYSFYYLCRNQSLPLSGPL